MTKQNLGDIFAKLLSDDTNKFDQEVPAGELAMFDNGKMWVPNNPNLGDLELSDWALTQLAGKLDIPVRYLKKCGPELQAQNVNAWLKGKDTSLLLRARRLEGGNALVRGVLSGERYSKLDNGHLAEMLQKILGNGDKADYGIEQFHLDDGSFHLRIVFNDLTTQIGTLRDGRPDIHKVGLHIANSEVGKRSVLIAPMVYRLVCTNGLMRWVAEDSLSLRHMYLKEHEIYGRVAEAIGVALKAGNEIVAQLIEAKQATVNNPLDILRNLAADKQYSQATTDRILDAYVSNEAQVGATVFTMIQAVTETAQLATSFDTRIDMEKDAAELLKMVA